MWFYFISSILTNFHTFTSFSWVTLSYFNFNILRFENIGLLGVTLSNFNFNILRFENIGNSKTIEELTLIK